MGRRAKIPGFVPTFGRCPICERPFPSRYALKLHRQVATCTTADRAPQGGGVRGGQ